MSSPDDSTAGARSSQRALQPSELLSRREYASKEKATKSADVFSPLTPMQAASNFPVGQASSESKFLPFPRFSPSLRWSDLASDDEDDSDVEYSETGHLLVGGQTMSVPQAVVDSSGGGSVDIPSSPSDAPTSSGDSSAIIEPVQTTFGFNLPLVPVPENCASSPFAENGTAYGSLSLASQHSAPSMSAQSDSVNHDSSLGDAVPRRGYAGALTMLYSAADARMDISASTVTPKDARVEAVLPVNNDEQVKKMVRSAARGFLAEQEPQVPREGMGGTYFLLDESGDPACIFKPCDEEPLAPNNPKGWAGRALGAPGMKPCVRVGEAALREVAAYLLDYNNFAGIPPACLVLCRHSKLNYTVPVPKIESIADFGAIQRQREDIPVPAAAMLSNTPSQIGLRGSTSCDALVNSCSSVVRTHLSVPSLPGGYKLGSLQAFAQHKCDANDFSPSSFSAENVHRIGILDIRLLNTDRHAGNLLVAETSMMQSAQMGCAMHAPYQLIPIDHGFALPEALEGPYFEWMFWSQTSVPFSEDVKAYVAQLDAKADVAMLQERLPTLRPECLRCLEVTTLVLKACTAAGLTLFEIASVFTRPSEQVPSDFETLCIDARDDALSAPKPPARTCAQLPPTWISPSTSSASSSTPGAHGLPPSSPTPDPDNNLFEMQLGDSKLLASLKSSHSDTSRRSPAGSPTVPPQIPHTHPASTASACSASAAPSDYRTSDSSAEACAASPSLTPVSPPTEAPPHALLTRSESPLFTAEDLGYSCDGGFDDSGSALTDALRSSPPSHASASNADVGSRGGGLWDKRGRAGVPEEQEPFAGGGQAASTAAASAPRPIEPAWMRTPAQCGSPGLARLGADPPRAQVSESIFIRPAGLSRNNSRAGFLGMQDEGIRDAGAGVMRRDIDNGMNASSMALAAPVSSVAGMGRASRTGRRGRYHRRNAWSRKNGAGVARAAYRPLLLAAHPDRACYVFSGLSEEQWLVFVESVQDFVSEELVKGTWRVGKSSGLVASSCPEPAFKL